MSILFGLGNNLASYAAAAKDLTSDLTSPAYVDDARFSGRSSNADDELAMFRDLVPTLQASLRESSTREALLNEQLRVMHAEVSRLQQLSAAQSNLTPSPIQPDPPAAAPPAGEPQQALMDISCLRPSLQALSAASGMQYQDPSSISAVGDLVAATAAQVAHTIATLRSDVDSAVKASVSTMERAAAAEDRARRAEQQAAAAAANDGGVGVVMQRLTAQLRQQTVANEALEARLFDTERSLSQAKASAAEAVAHRADNEAVQLAAVTAARDAAVQSAQQLAASASAAEQRLAVADALRAQAEARAHAAEALAHQHARSKDASDAQVGALQSLLAEAESTRDAVADERGAALRAEIARLESELVGARAAVADAQRRADAVEADARRRVADAEVVAGGLQAKVAGLIACLEKATEQAASADTIDRAVAGRTIASYVAAVQRGDATTSGQVLVVLATMFGWDDAARVALRVGGKRPSLLERTVASVFGGLSAANGPTTAASSEEQITAGGLAALWVSVLQKAAGDESEGSVSQATGAPAGDAGARGAAAGDSNSLSRATSRDSVGA